MNKFDFRTEMFKFVPDLTSSLHALYLGNSTVYHYTSPEGLQKIIEDKNFLFSDSDFLNDKDERKDFYKLLNEILTKDADSETREIRNVLLKISNNNLSDNNEGVMAQNKERFRFFVFSCSENSDNLLLWNNYTKNQNKQGYNIEIPLNELGSIIHSFEKNLRPVVEFTKTQEHSSGWFTVSPMNGKVIYEQNQKCEILQKIVQRCSNFWNSHCKEQWQKELFTQQLDVALAKLSLFFKNDGYAGEQEYRFVLATRNQELSEYADEQERTEQNKSKESKYGYRLVEGIPIPYIKVNFSSQSAMIESVTISFGYKSDISVSAVEYLLHTNHFMPRVHRSKIPLRY